MFDNQQRSTAFQQFAECAEQLGNVIEMQSRRRFVENVEDALIVGAAQVRRQLQALRFSARKRCRRLSETQVAQANLIQNSEFGNDLGNIDEKSQGFADRELQYLVDILPVIPHFQNAALEARAPALVADQLDVRQKLHLHGNRAVPLAGFAAPSRHVEGKVTCGITAALRIRGLSKYFADRVERFQICGRIRAGKEQLAAEFARARTEIDDVIRGLDSVRIVLHDENRVSQIAKRLENIDEPLRVARVQANRRLIKHVKCANEMRTERCGQLDPL